MRIPMIAGNWKMNTTVSEATALVKAMRDGLSGVSKVESVLCPPFVSLAAVRALLRDTPVKLGAQNVFYVEKGAYTGEISPPMLAELCDYVIIGHSERRQYFHETGEITRKKVAAALAAGLKPILCVGERLEQNESGQTETVVTGQLDDALKGIGKTPGLVIAYEPVWAIGTGRAATGEQANAVIGLIRRHLGALAGKSSAAETRILYGGSVTAANTGEFLGQAEIDGALVGGASLKADEFLGIVTLTAAVKG
ncbi:MAG: triose-phosphate isomerase [Chloroflexota bacterium]